MKQPHIKLILWDFNGVTVVGDHKSTTRHFGRKHGTPWQQAYAVFYTKYFNQLALNKISERTAWLKPIEELGWKEDWRRVRKFHLDQQRIRKSIVQYVLRLRRRGYRCVLFTKNYQPWLRYHEQKFHFRKYFDEVLNTQRYNLPKAGKKTIRFVCRKYRVKPNEIIYIDDQEQNLTDARAMGVHTILYKNFADMRRTITSLLGNDRV